VGKGFGDSINEEAYNHQRGWHLCTKSIAESHHKYIRHPTCI
jgi:hypothetical protein